MMLRMLVKVLNGCKTFIMTLKSLFNFSFKSSDRNPVKEVFPSIRTFPLYLSMQNSLFLLLKYRLIELCVLYILCCVTVIACLFMRILKIFQFFISFCVRDISNLLLKGNKNIFHWKRHKRLMTDMNAHLLCFGLYSLKISLYWNQIYQIINYRHDNFNFAFQIFMNSQTKNILNNTIC